MRWVGRTYSVICAAWLSNHGLDGKARHEDEGLPMGARIGSVVQMQKGSVIRAQTNGSLIGMPDDGDTRVLAVSQIKLNLDGALFRFYLAKGDQDADEKFLQVYADPDGDIAEIMYCTQLARVVPETAEDQDAYTGVAKRGPGRPVLHAVARAVGRPAQRCRPGHRVRRQRPHRLHARRKQSGRRLCPSFLRQGNADRRRGRHAGLEAGNVLHAVCA
ncbi:YjfK family protein [Massilia sp. B-10]|nr:YjfK family protein [Massilia sp. B-10]